MATEDFRRKLTAIFSADVEGYSRLMGEDELATVQTLTSYKETMRKLIMHYRGRVVDSTGDNLLAEFVSVVDAVQCAVEVQQIIKGKNEDLPENRRMLFRIGINLGDVIEEDDRIFGDGVNIAARVESLSEGGGVCISGSAYEQIENKLALGYQYMGEHTVKNIAKPIKVYKVPMGPVEVKTKVTVKGWRKVAIAAGVLLILAGALAFWNFYLRPDVEPASLEKMAFPLPDKPSIAVLPFANMSGDPEQEYIADGITENIISALSKIPKLFVIARNSTFTYKGTPVKVQKVAEDLGVQYVLEGSVQRSGDSLRITAQLIDALGGHHLWSERYDRKLKDIFALQDEITLRICNALQMELTSGEQARMWHKGTKNLEAWGCIVKGTALFVRMTKGDNAKARDLYERAVKIDPKDSFAWTMLAWTHWIDAFLGYSESRAESFKQAVGLAKKALSMDDTLSDAYALLGGISLFQRQYEKAIAAGEKSIALGPNSATSHVLFGYTMTYAGRFDEAIALIKKGMRLTPHYPAFYLNHLGRPYFQTGRYEEALAIYKKLLERSRKGEFNPLSVHLNLAATYIMLGREEEARAHVAEVLRISPNLSLEWVRKAAFYKNPVHLERVLIALRKAGLPDKPPLPLPDKPSIAVLPFVNMSGDPEQEYFSDGMTEEIITALSKVPQLFVIARNSSFTYKGKPVKVQQVGGELGVRYVLEGSVRKAGDKVRITAQLIDAKTNKHLWAERYDRDLKDIFAVQDDITMKIITAMEVKLTEGESAQLYAKGTENLEAYLRVLKGREYLYRLNKEDNARARKMCKEAIALDPEYPMPFAILGWTHWHDVFLGWTKSPRESMKRAVESAQKSIALDDSFPLARGLLSAVYLMQRQHDKAILEAEKAVALDPNSADDHARLGNVFNFAGRPEEAILAIEKAIRLNPFPPSWYFNCLGMAYRETGRYEESITACKKALQRQPTNTYALLVLAATYSLLNRQEEAHATAAEVLRIDPEFSLERLAKVRPHVDPGNTERFIKALRKAGLK